ncbi:biotin-dependent carboxyltransferase family protein [Pseudooceanicola sp. CBS1P-1]|uniref:Urea amidolyase n=1 Tax=Pseudooceanicola albus TaxID=2692189 RepID=A0A6L7G0G3_9RHOB|nr:MULTISPECIES: biotin-dependent carboxyltransferase family protein [Pseudooceanicola]MBT9382643.1 biotin-dependent carboxyltransferase family protein [Pseudooceanicola endophyticus]MXN17182.1 urea amidolyase [Pseudooceanicola albus]
MSATLEILEAGPGLSVQDLGRPGLAAQGLSRGGALDPLALFEAAALLARPAPEAAIEMPGLGGLFRVSAATRIALTGAPMRAARDGVPLAWHAAHLLSPGETLRIGPVEAGTTGYLSFGGGIATTPWMGSRSTHLAAGIGALLRPGDQLPLGDDTPRPARRIRPEARFAGGEIRVLPGPQTDLFSDAQRAAFAAAPFTRGSRSNRQAMQLQTGAEPLWFRASGGMASEPIQAGDIQITGDGTPYVLLAECQTIGGYPRIGSVHPADMAKLAQAGAGAPLHFRWSEIPEALPATPEALLNRLRGAVSALVRDPADIADLLSYQLISGVTAGDDLELSD